MPRNHLVVETFAVDARQPAVPSLLRVDIFGTDADFASSWTVGDVAGVAANFALEASAGISALKDQQLSVKPGSFVVEWVLMIDLALVSQIASIMYDVAPGYLGLRVLDVVIEERVKSWGAKLLGALRRNEQAPKRRNTSWRDYYRDLSKEANEAATAIAAQRGCWPLLTSAERTKAQTYCFTFESNHCRPPLSRIEVTITAKSGVLRIATS